MSTEWSINSNRTLLSFGSFECKVYKDDNEVLLLPDEIALIEGVAQLEITGGRLTLEYKSHDELPHLNISANSAFTIKFRPFIPLNADTQTLVTWALTGEGEIAAEITLKLTFGTDVKVDLKGAKSLLQILLENYSGEIEKLGSSFLRTRAFDFPLLRFLNEIERPLGSLDFTLGSPIYSNGILSFDSTTVNIKDRELTIDEFHIGIEDLAVRVDGLSASVEKDFPIVAGADKPLTLILREGSKIALGLRMNSPGLSITPSPSIDAAMIAIVPGIDLVEDQEVLADSMPDRLIFDMYPAESDKGLKIGPNGLRGVAKLRIRPLELGVGLTDCRLTEGQLTFRDSLFEAEVKATAKLPYFRDSEGSLTIRTSSVGGFSAVWQMAAGKSWTDPTGNFVVHEPRAAVTIKAPKDSNKWVVTGKIGGQLHFIGIDKLDGAAREWLAGFADMLRMKFEDLDISNLLPLPSTGLPLNLSGLPGSLDLWNIFHFKLDSFSLFKDGFSLGGLISLKEAGSGLSFQGKLPNLRCLVKDGKISLSTSSDGGLSFSGQLSTPGGVSVALDLRRETDERGDELIGSGALSIPSMPAIAITCALGQRKGKKDPTRRDPIFLLFIRTGIAVPLFPGVVLRDIGIGMGINKVMKIVDETSHDELVSQLVNGSAGFPDPGDQSSWSTPDRDGFDLSLVADTYIAPAQEGSKTFPYVGSATLYARPTTDFVILLGANLWLMTSIDDAKRSDVRQRPAAVGALALFPRHGFLELKVRTKKNSFMTDEVELLRMGLESFSGELYLKATRDEFLFRVGPMQSSTTFGPIRLSGSVTFATYVGQHGAIAVLQGALEGSVRHSAEVKLRFGPLTVTAGFYFEAEVAFETVMAGMYTTELGLALYQNVRAYASVSIAVSVRIEFRLVIKFWRFKKTISWSQSHSTSLKLSVDLWLEILVGKTPAFYGQVRVNVRLFGYDFSPTLQVGRPDKRLDYARKTLLPLLNPRSNQNNGV